MARTRLATSESSASKSKRGALQVHESLREDILWLRIEPGSALDEVALAERFEVSRTPIREALLLLSGEGLGQVPSQSDYDRRPDVDGQRR